MAELTGKRHDSVKRTIETLVARGVIESPQSVGIKTATKTGVEYRVGKRDSYVIVAQLSPEFTTKVIDRLRELEQQVAAPTMSSREIAELTGKRHDNVVRDIRNMLAELGDDSDLRNVVETKDARGYTDRFNLPKDLTITLVSGYNVKMRYAITKRWMELEAQQVATPALPTSFAEALRLAAALEEQKETLRLENEAMKPDAAVGHAVGQRKHLTIMSFIKKLPGVNTMQVRKTLAELGYIYRRAGCWNVYAKYKGSLFSATFDERGYSDCG